MIDLIIIAIIIMIAIVKKTDKASNPEIREMHQKMIEMQEKKIEMQKKILEIQEKTIETLRGVKYAPKMCMPNGMNY